MSAKRTKKAKDALEIIADDVGDDPEFHQMVEEEKLNAQVARMIYEARIEAGLSQQALAELIGTKQPVIARLEDADYEGHSLSMLQRIAEALHRRLQIRFLPEDDLRRSA